MKFLIIGANGQVGYELQRSLAPLGSVTAIDYPEINIADVDALRQYVRSQAPDVLVNAAAYTAVDKAEAEEAVALAVNGTASLGGTISEPQSGNLTGTSYTVITYAGAAGDFSTFNLTPPLLASRQAAAYALVTPPP